MLNSKIFFIMLKIIIWLIRSNCRGGGGFMVGFFEYYFKLQFIVRFGECIFGKILSRENNYLRCCHDISSSKNRASHRKSPPGKIAIPMKKLCTTEIIPFAPQNI